VIRVPSTNLAATIALLSSVAIAGQALTVENAIERSAERYGTSPIFGATLVNFFVTVPIIWGMAYLQGIPVDALTPRRIAPFVLADAAFPAMSRLV